MGHTWWTSQSQHRNHPPFVKWPVLLCRTTQESCYIYQHSLISKSTVFATFSTTEAWKALCWMSYFLLWNFKKKTLSLATQESEIDLTARLKRLLNNWWHIHKKRAVMAKENGLVRKKSNGGKTKEWEVGKHSVRKVNQVYYNGFRVKLLCLLINWHSYRPGLVLFWLPSAKGTLKWFLCYCQYGFRKNQVAYRSRRWEDHSGIWWFSPSACQHCKVVPFMSVCCQQRTATLHKNWGKRNSFHSFKTKKVL